MATPQLGMSAAAENMEGEGMPLVFSPQATMIAGPGMTRVPLWSVSYDDGRRVGTWEIDMPPEELSIGQPFIPSDY